MGSLNRQVDARIGLFASLSLTCPTQIRNTKNNESSYPKKMTIALEPQLKSGDGRLSPLLPSIGEKIQQHEPEGVAETTIIIPKNGGQDPKKPVHTHDNAQEEDIRSTASRTAPASPEIAANPTLPDSFGRENDKYISGYKLFAALFGIISVSFIVLLDFSIISTVSTDSPQNHCVPRVLYHCAR